MPLHDLKLAFDGPIPPQLSKRLAGFEEVWPADVRKGAMDVSVDPARVKRSELVWLRRDTEESMFFAKMLMVILDVHGLDVEWTLNRKKSA